MINLAQMRRIAKALGMRGAASALRIPPPRHYAYGSASEGRLRACAGMSTAALRRRISRGVWSSASIAAAKRILAEREATV